MSIATGHGTTIAFTDSAFTAAVIEIGGYSQEREALDATSLSTTNFREMIAGDLASPGSFDIRFFFDTTDGLPSINQAAETTTITTPATGGGSNMTIAGTAFLTSVTSPAFVTDTLMEASATIQWDGFTGPALTVEA